MREEARDLHREAWRRTDGGQELTLRALDLEREADRLEAALASAQPRPEVAGEREALGLGDAMKIAELGFKNWAEKPHNARWFRKIDGTPISNDLPINIAEAFVDALRVPVPSSEGST